MGKNKNHVREVARIVGKLISFYRSTVPVARVMTRVTYHIIAKAANWNCSITLDEEARIQLLWWVDADFADRPVTLQTVQLTS